jgi:hypothetical protein
MSGRPTRLETSRGLLRKPLPQSPLVLEQEQGTKFGESGSRRLIERFEHRFPVVDCQPKDLCPEREPFLQLRRDVREVTLARRIRANWKTSRSVTAVPANCINWA